MKIHLLSYNVHGLPWCRTDLYNIGKWVIDRKIPVCCFQELFTTSGRNLFQAMFERAGYEVLLPKDQGVCLFPSGLMICILSSKYKVISTSFRSYLHYQNTDQFANKGFFSVILYDTAINRLINIINTHTQSDWELTFLTGRHNTCKTRYKQAEQILEEFQTSKIPVLVVGDLNQETSLHPYLQSLHPLSAYPLKKATFYSTGEDLDHIAWMPLQWAPMGCGFCDIRKKGPQYEICKIHDLPWSDHAALEAVVSIPDLKI